MKDTKRLLDIVRQRIASGCFTDRDLAEKSGVEITSLRTMLLPDWSNRAVSNLEAIGEALPKMRKKPLKRKPRGPNEPRVSTAKRIRYPSR